MSKELVIGSNRHETKVAVLEEDQLVEVYFQRANEYSLAGSIHKGRVTRVLPGMQSAFVDLGLERDTFLYVSDFFEENEDIDTVVDEKPVAVDRSLERSDRSNERSDRNSDRSERNPERGERSNERRERPPVRQALPASYISSAAAAAQESGEVRSTPAQNLPPEIDDDFADEVFSSVSSIGSLPGEFRAADLVGTEPKLAESRPVQSRPAEAPNREASPESRGEDFRGGDRRGRRSRRRRSRGGGFPDNKYAQPGAETVEHPESALVAKPPVEPETDRFDRVEPIILPGESLAKYRHLGSTPEPEPLPVYRLDPESDIEDAGNADRTATAESAPEDEPAYEEALNQEEIEEEIEEEARALEFADRVLSHADEYVDEDEEKYAEVRHDQPSSPFIVNDIEADDAAEEGASEALPTGLNAPVSLHHSEKPTPEPHQGFYEYSQFAEQPPTHVHGPTLEASGRGPDRAEISDEDDPDAEGDFEEASESGPIGVEATPVPGVSTEGEEPGAQTASVREQGGQYMHRVSRRMRRRRGGNRQGQQPSAPASGGSEFAGESAMGTAATLQPERREMPTREMAPVEERVRERSERPERTERPERSDRPERVLPSISELLKPGQEIIVQIAKEPLGQKGARITSHIALPGRFIVFMPSVNHLGVSRKIASDEERLRLKRVLQTHRVGTVGGFIVRTAGEGITEEDIAADMDFLYKLWLDIRQKAEKKPAPALLHYDLDVVQRILRDQVTEEFKAIWVDNEDMYENVLSFMQRFQPALVSRVKMYTRSAPIFDAFGITQELEKALRPKVWLKSGGYIVINQTEALVAIDINTGKYVGKSNRLEDTIVKTNTEAVKEIVRQIRLRDLGGIIVVDFIDMDERKNRQKVMQALEEAMRADKAPYKILQFNDFGLVAITRKRVKQSLERTLCSPCPYCEGAGYVKSVQTVIGEILIEAQKIAKAIEGKDVLLRVHPDVAKVLKANDNKYLEELEQSLSRPVLVKGDATLHIEKFDLG